MKASLVLLGLFAAVFAARIDINQVADKESLEFFIKELVKNYVPNTSEPSTLYRNKKEGEEPIVQTGSGPVKGFVSVSSRDNVEYSAFVGIPFAQPPVGELRFKAPLPVEPWTEVRDATKEGSGCMAVIGLGTSEDCLFLNVFTPQLPSSEKSEPKAVMVFIYGGAFLAGSSASLIYAPDFFVEKDVIFVTLNYRLGALGFLSLQNEDAPGNAGIKDQILALRWVKENIANFGGDPERITVFGESAGSASTSYIQLSPLAKGLMNGVIMESGNALSLWGYITPELAVRHAYTLGAAVGCDYDINLPESKAELFTCLQGASATSLALLSAVDITLEEIDTLRFFGFIPTVEPDLEGAVITKHPNEMLQAGDFNKVNTMLGENNREGLLIKPILDIGDPTGIITRIVLGDLTHFIPLDLLDAIDETQADHIADEIRDYYFNGSAVTLSRRLQLIDLVTDSHFTMSVQKWAKLVAEKSSAPVYNYLFSYEGPFNLFKIITLQNDTAGVCHADEIGYLMNVFILRGLYDNYERDSVPHKTIDRLVGMWTNFAKTGNPTPTVDDVINTAWEPFTSETHNYLDIGSELVLKQGLLSDRMHFWNGIYEETQNEPPFPE